jgi:hypothetical protein
MHGAAHGAHPTEICWHPQSHGAAVT